MTGHKAPSGSLRNYGASASQSRSKGGANLFSSRTDKKGSGKITIGTKSFKTNEFVDGSGDESSSSSSSDSDSHSDSDSEKTESAIGYQKRLSSSKTNGASVKKKSSPDKKVTVDKKTSPVKKESPEEKKPSSILKATPVKPPTVNGLSSATKKEPLDEKVAKKEQTPDSDSSSKEDSDSNEESESDSSENETAKKPDTTKNTAKVAVKKVEESDSETGSSKEESESGSEEESGSESEGSGSDDDSENNTKDQIETQLETDANSRAKKSIPSPSISPDEDGNVDMMDQSMALTNGGHATDVGSVPEFVAPDFMVRKLVGNIGDANMSSFVAKAQSEGKQIWYITVPATLPVTVVQDLSIPLDSAKAGEKALSHDGEDYNMTFEDPSVSSSFKLLIPSKTGTDYTILDRSIDQTVHLTRSTTFPPEGPAFTTTSKTVSITKPARPQPEGLRPRFTPVGVPVEAKPFIAPPNAKSKSAVAKIAAPMKRKLEGGALPDSAKKQKMRDVEAIKSSQPPPRQTPIPLPPHIRGMTTSTKSVSASQFLSQSAQSPAPKQTPIPPPTIPTNRPTVQTSEPSFYSVDNVRKRDAIYKANIKAEKAKMKMAEKEKKLRAKRFTLSPRKVTPVPCPTFGPNGQRLS